MDLWPSVRSGFYDGVVFPLVDISETSLIEYRWGLVFFFLNMVGFERFLQEGDVMNIFYCFVIIKIASCIKEMLKGSRK